jgi:hypothetical protein
VWDGFYRSASFEMTVRSATLGMAFWSSATCGTAFIVVRHLRRR